MIRPEKHLNLHTSVLAVGALVLNLLHVVGRTSLVSVEQEIANACGLGARPNLYRALLLLYLLGVLEYQSEDDTVVLLSRGPA